ncbi:MAG: UDP-N-acetylmuramoyl-tripeptide--D-alanyl-D-alanine ligase [Bacteroidia bacterium]|nr:UDP-N-acetylmuramoyl-tripeptide--D-alanyl-D-alanine ligase [Bacteroidia bacterium]MCO5252812.1 UDP-N-acetylmuramoyl-tripeptide--D-alanyl-D-alanine ligase [Bacteroidota bacterium]MCZ2131429.1 UDP-N-acetylmuramoyl-tripeptide--D-alanyl-D-alanine ligase [Bacteroidia bacterium]
MDLLYSYYLDSHFQVYTDTRKPIEGALFFALKGPGFNGNKFLRQALEQGASWVVGDEHPDFESDKVILVEDVLTTLQNLALYHRHQCKAKVLGIGGSNGKTTTKELLKKVLETQYKMHATPGNFNNHIGVPLTLLSMPVDTEIVLVELGTNQKGDIEQLCNICHPDCGLITNIGKEHLEGFGSIEAVAHEESYLYQYLVRHDGTAFVNHDDTWLASMSKRLKNKVEYSITDLTHEQLAPEIIAKSKTDISFKSHLAGLHNLVNMAAARAVGLYFGINELKIAEAIASYKPGNMRSEWRKTDKNLIFLDAYNANPSSMEVAIHTLQSVKADKKIAILGDMFELGDFAPSEHQSIFEMAQKAGFDKVITVGKEFCKVNHTADSFENTADLIEYFRNNQVCGNTILVKGSRGMKLEELLPYL